VSPATISPSVLAVIPARGGSKGIARKNLIELGGHPLLAWTIRAAQAAKSLDRVVVSTDDPEIAETALRYGAEVPFQRPAGLALDCTPDLPVFVHALEWFDRNEGYRPELIVHLRPTTPFRKPEDIDRAVGLLRERDDADSVRSVVVPFQNPFKMWRLGGDGCLVPLIALDEPEAYNLPRGLLPVVFWHNGYIDVVRRETILGSLSMTGRRILPLLGAEEWIDIDGLDVLRYAEYLLRSHAVQPVMPVAAARGREPASASFAPTVLGEPRG
jgi:CMP-N,N'-diacetyllegionaminic acid synthase